MPKGNQNPSSKGGGDEELRNRFKSASRALISSKMSTKTCPWAAWTVKTWSNIHYLNQFVDVASHNLVEGHARDDLQVLSSHDLVCPFHRQPLVIPNTRRTGISFLLPFVGHPRPFGGRSRDLFNRSGWRGHPHHLRAGDNSSDGGRWSSRGALPRDTHGPFPEAGKRLMLLRSHLCIQVLVEFGCHFCKRKTLVKKKKTRVYQKISIEEPNTFFSFNFKIVQMKAEGSGSRQ